MHGWQSNDIYCAVQGKLSLLRLLKRQEVLIKQDQQGAFLLMHGADWNIQCVINEHSQEYLYASQEVMHNANVQRGCLQGLQPKGGSREVHISG